MGTAISEQPDPVVAEDHELKRTLGPVHLTMIGIGASSAPVSSSIPARSRRPTQGPAVLLSFVIAALGCLFAGLCYARVRVDDPVSGSAYTYAYATMGRFMAWFIGWNLVLEYLVSSSAVAVGWSGYFTELMQILHINFPASLANAPLCVCRRPPALPAYRPTDHGARSGRVPQQFGHTGAIMNLPAAALVLLLTGCARRGRARIRQHQRDHGRREARRRAAG